MFGYFCGYYCGQILRLQYLTSPMPPIQPKEMQLSERLKFWKKKIINPSRDGKIKERAIGSARENS